MRTAKTADDDATLCVKTQSVKPKTGKSFRATKQPTPTKGVGLTNTVHPQETLEETIRAQVRADAAPFTVPEALMRQEVKNRMRLLASSPSAQHPQISENRTIQLAPAKVPFTLELTVPAWPDGLSPIQLHRDLPPHDLRAPQSALVIRLRAGAPFRLLLDGHSHFTRPDYGWPAGQRVTWTIRAAADPVAAERLRWTENAAHPEQDNFLLVPVAFDQPVEVLRDGQLVGLIAPVGKEVK